MSQNYNQDESDSKAPPEYKRPSDFALWSFVTGIITLALLASTSREEWAEWKDASESIRNFGLAGAGLLAATVGVYLAWKRTTAAVHQAVVAAKKEAREEEDSKEALYTELFTKAVEQLAHKNLSIRLGGIYALERLARESQKDHWRIMKVLAAFIRQHSPWKMGRYYEAAKDGRRPFDPRDDIKAALHAIGLRNTQFDPPDANLNLESTDLACVRVEDHNFDGVIFRSANLRFAMFDGASLVGCDFGGANMEVTEFIGANLQGATFMGGNMSMVRFHNANLTDAYMGRIGPGPIYFGEAIVENTKFSFVDLSKSQLTQDQLSEAFVKEGVILPGGVVNANK